MHSRSLHHALRRHTLNSTGNLYRSFTVELNSKKNFWTLLFLNKFNDSHATHDKPIWLVPHTRTAVEVYIVSGTMNRWHTRVIRDATSWEVCATSFKMVWIYPTEALKALVRSGVISWTSNGKRGRGRSNLTWEEFVKRDLKDWSITKELTLDRREWKLAIHVAEPWSLIPPLLLHFCISFSLFIRSFSPFLCFGFYCLFPLLCFVYYCSSSLCPPPPPSFSL
jgi:hypothetical protein